MPAFAVNDDGGVFGKPTEEVRLYFVLLLLGVVARHSAAAVAPRLLDDAFLSKEIGTLYRAFFVGGFEDETVAEIERKDPRLLTVNGAEVTVDLTGVTNAQKITLTLFNVSDGTNTSDVSVQMGILLGDVNSSGVVTGADVNLAKAQQSQTVSEANFRTDVNANGVITGSDVNLVKARQSSSLP